jgi:hypothetical protein
MLVARKDGGRVKRLHGVIHLERDGMCFVRPYKNELPPKEHALAKVARFLPALALVCVSRVGTRTLGAIHGSSFRSSSPWRRFHLNLGRGAQLPLK